MAKNKISLTDKDADFVIRHIPNSELKDRLKAFIKEIDLHNKIERFLTENQKDSCCIPTISELGKLTGGYALVKEISQAGGLKKVRVDYTRFLFKRLNNK